MRWVVRRDDLMFIGAVPSPGGREVHEEREREKNDKTQIKPQVNET